MTLVDRDHGTEGSRNILIHFYCKFPRLYLSPWCNSNALWFTAMQDFNGRREEDSIFSSNDLRKILWGPFLLSSEDLRQKRK